MEKYVRIGPNALFAIEVLSPEWGSQYRQQTNDSARRAQSAQASPRDNNLVDGDTTPTAADRGREQMALL